MIFNSMEYLAFFIISFTVYYLLPKKIRYIWLLIISYYFYGNWNIKYTLLIFIITLLSYISAIFIEKNTQTPKLSKIILIISIIICLAPLVYYKYFNFLIYNINFFIANLCSSSLISPLDIILPVGISFYTFQALGYIIDVYRGDINAEKNLIRYALFVSFFPQLVAGPIERSKNLLHQLAYPKSLTASRLRNGLLFILVGLWQKILIADQIAAIINPIFNDFTLYPGAAIILSTMLFGIQIYCDFGGYSNIARGSALLFGIDLMNNFSSPYLATSVPDFWRRWHISLTSWFRDYLYIPLGGNRKGVFRKSINILIVFLCSGIWHGASWNFIFWGILNGTMIVSSNLITNYQSKRVSFRKAVLFRKRILTFISISFSWLFFRSPSLSYSFDILKHIASGPGIRYLLCGQILEIFPSVEILFILIISIFLLFKIDSIKEKAGDFNSVLLKQDLLTRWVFYIFLILSIIIFGAYGEGYEQTEFIYFQF